MIQHDTTTANGPLLTDWTQPSSHMSFTRGKTGVVERSSHTHRQAEGRDVLHITTVRIDLAKSVFQLHKMDVRGHAMFSM